MNKLPYSLKKYFWDVNFTELGGMMEKIPLYIFIIVGVLLIYQFYLMGIGRKKKKHSLIIIKKSKRFNSKQANKVSPDKLKEYINGIDITYLQERPGWFELYEDEKIVFLNVPWGEAYCQCNADEYKELTNYIYKVTDTRIIK